MHSFSLLKSALLSAVLLSALMRPALADTISLDFTVGVLANSDGSLVLSDGALLQIIASPDTTFATPTTASFLGDNSNDVLLWQGSFDSNTSGTAGVMILSLPSIDLSTTPVAGDYLAVRWFPSLSGSTIPSSPGSTSYGQFDYSNDNTWIVVSSGYFNYHFLTQSSGFGSSPDSLGYASNITAVPEPSSYAAIVALFSLGLLIKHGWRRTKSAA